jgi:hypothetical protein
MLAFSNFLKSSSARSFTVIATNPERVELSRPLAIWPVNVLNSKPKKSVKL